MSDRSSSLCDRARDGDTAAASELVALHYATIYAHLRRLCGSDEDAADLTQKTFFKAWLSLASFQNRSSFSTWLHGIAHHVHVDWRRSLQPADTRTDDWWEKCHTGNANPFDDVAERDLAHRVYSLVEQLAEEVRQVVHLHYYQGLTIRETAEALNIATSTVKYRAREALDFLRSRAEPALRQTQERS